MLIIALCIVRGAVAFLFKSSFFNLQIYIFNIFIPDYKINFYFIWILMIFGSKSLHSNIKTNKEQQVWLLLHQHKTAS